MAPHQRHPWLPVRPALADREALDCFLERLAAANELTPSGLLRRLTASDVPEAPTAAFMMIKPDPLIVGRLVGLTGLDANAIERATLMRFGGGLPLHLDRLDSRQRHTCRQVMAQAWFPPIGSQACPLCLSQDGIWQVDWRLPHIAVCAEHRTFLVTHCDSCGRRFRTHRFRPIRPVLGENQPCGNAFDPQTICRHSVLNHRAQAATPPVLDSALAISQAIAGQSAMLLDREVDPRVFLDEIRRLATLLLHLAMLPGADTLPSWVVDVQAEAAAHPPSARDRLWRTRPPESSVVRGQALSEAHAVLRQPTMEEAADRLRPWLDLIVGVPGGMSRWFRNRTLCTPLTIQLIDTAAFSWHRVGEQLKGMQAGRMLRPENVPQLIDPDIYHDLFASLLGGYGSTGRLYASLCVLRAVVPTADWEEAAVHIRLDPAVGKCIARTASSRMCVSPNIFSDAVSDACFRLPRDRNFREREARVRALTLNPEEWFERWRSSTSPRRRHTSWTFAAAWMWQEVAQGWPRAVPLPSGQLTRRFNASYSVFRNSLSVPAQAALRSLVLEEGRRLVLQPEADRTRFRSTGSAP